MKKIIVLAVIVLSLLLVGCGGAIPQVASPTSTPVCSRVGYREAVQGLVFDVLWNIEAQLDGTQQSQYNEAGLLTRLNNIQPQCRDKYLDDFGTVELMITSGGGIIKCFNDILCPVKDMEIFTGLYILSIEKITEWYK